MELRLEFVRYSPEGLETFREGFAPAERRDCAWSRVYYCFRCGNVYARAFASIDGKLAPWNAVSGICSNCPSDRWHLANSLQSVYLNLEKFPPQALFAEFLAELTYYDQQQGTSHV